RSRGNDLGGSGRPGLAAGHGIGEIIDADHLDVHIAARGVNEVVAADGEQVAIAGVDHHLQLRVGELESGGEGDGAPVGGVEAVQVGVSGDATRAADTGDDGDLVQVQLGALQRPGEAVHRGADAAGRAPYVRHAVHAEEGLYRIGRGHRRVQRAIDNGFTHRAASRMAFRMTSGLCTVPPACGTEMTLARPAVWRSTSWTIWPRFSSGTTKAFTRPARSRMCCSGKGQAEMMRKMPART